MFVQTEVTPNPNSLKFLPEKKVSNSGPYEITKKDNVKNELVRNILAINGVEGVFLGENFISVNKKNLMKWDDIKHIVISLINDFYSDGNEFVIDENLKEQKSNLGDIEQKIVKILDQKIRPAVARDGGDIKFREFKDGIVKVKLQGSCSGCPSSTMTLKQGVQNLLCHYLPEVKEVVAE
jgi:NFU1 iron-sulfur cluster scaffold homolog, mitochondrial